MPASLAPRSQRPGAPLTVRARGEDDLRRRLGLLTVARLGVAALLVVGTSLSMGGAPGSVSTSRALLSVVLALFGASVVYAFLLNRGRGLRALAVAQIGLDIAAWTALVYVTGGPGSPMSFFYALSALTAALVLGARAAQLTALVAVGAYGTLTVLVTSGTLPLPADQLLHPQPSRPELASQLTANVLAVFLVAALGGSLASRLSRAGGVLAQLEASRDALAALYEDVVRSIPVALLTCSADGVIQGANPGAEALFAVPASELLGARVTDWLPFLPADAFAAESEPRVGDATLERVPSRPRVAYRAAPLYDRQGRARGGLVVVEDRSSAEILREAVQRAERLAVLGRLAAGLAHEIRNPLGAISGGVELVREGGAASAEDRDLLATVSREVARLNDLVNDMLTFARPRTPERVPTDLAALAREVVALSGARGGVRVRVRDDAEGEREARATVDPGQLRQVLWNLLRNAEKVSPEGADVEVGVRETDAGVELSVCDRGPGVAPELRERIFDAFYTEQTRGTGLGLAIVKQIVDEHRGAVSVRAREGGGSEFVVVLPRE